MSKWIVAMTLEWEMPVVAETQAEAQRIAEANASRDLMYTGEEARGFARLVTKREQLPPSFTGCRAYAERGTTVEDDLIVDEWFK